LGRPSRRPWPKKRGFFVSSVIFDYRGKVGDLYIAPFTFVDSTHGQVLRLWHRAGERGFRARRSAANWGLGLLGQGSLLAVKAGSLATSPTKRGHLVRSSLLCYPVPAPPAVVPDLPEPTAAETTPTAL